MKKKLLEENTIRQFMKLAQLEPLASDFLKEGEDLEMEENADVYTEEAAVYTEEAEADMEDTDVDMEELDVDIEEPESDTETEINITPDQARAIIAVADMLKDIMPEMEGEEEEEELDMEEPEAEMGAKEEELTEQIMRRVQNRLREIKNK